MRATAANITKVKRKMRDYIGVHGLDPVRMTPVPVWGSHARLAAWRVSGHLKSHGKHLEQSAQYTQDLVDALFPPTVPQRAVQIARGEVGTTESPAGSNDGPRVRLYQSSTGAYKAPWCASFVTWCYQRAAKDASASVRVPPLPAWVPSWTQTIRAGERGWRRVEPAEARAGDVVTLWGSQHIEMVTGRDGMVLLCIGGNTSPEGRNANGGGVFKTRRGFDEVTVVGRLS